MIIVNGIPATHVHALDRGLMYGDGVFRTLLVRAGKPICWHRQFDKLRADCMALNIDCPSRELLEQDLAQTTQSDADCVVKIVITRGLGARGYATSRENHSTRIISSSPLPERKLDQRVMLHVCEIRLAHQPRLAGIKHLNRLENVLARMEWQDPEITEGVLLDEQANVIEGTMSNLFMRVGSVLHTADLSRCGVAGITRDRIMALAPEFGLNISIADYSLGFLLQAEEVLLCNSVMGVLQVRKCQEKQWERGFLAEKINHFLDRQEN